MRRVILAVTAVLGAAGLLLAPTASSAGTNNNSSTNSAKNHTPTCDPQPSHGNDAAHGHRQCASP
jgi:hypothetical protein